MTLQLGQHTSVKSPRSPRRHITSNDEVVSFTIDPHVEKKIAPLIARLRDLCLRRGDGAFRDVGNLLGVGRSAAVAKGRRPSSYNSNEVVKLNPEAFKLTIAQFGVVLTTADVDMLLLAFKDTVGYLVVTNFLRHLAATINKARRAVVDEAFDSLPCDAEGLVAVSAMAAQYHPEAHPFVTSGHTTAEGLMRQFLEAFDEARAPNSKVSREEFVYYYAGISYGIAEDEAFIDMVRGLWDLYEKPPPPVVERCFVPAPNADSGERWTSPVRGGVVGAGGDVPKTIVGYTGHVPGVSERYGESFATTQRLVEKKHLTQRPERYIPEAGEHLDDPLQLKQTNKANKHNFTFA